MQLRRELAPLFIGAPSRHAQRADLPRARRGERSFSALGPRAAAPERVRNEPWILPAGRRALRPHRPLAASTAMLDTPLRVNFFPRISALSPASFFAAS